MTKRCAQRIQGRLRFVAAHGIIDDAFDSEKLIEFLASLIKDAGIRSF